LSTYFHGSTFSASLDGERLTRQLDTVRALMLRAGGSGQWLSLREIAALTNYPEASISARLRDLRHREHGGYIVARRRRGNPTAGLHEYSVHEAPPATQEKLF